MRPEAMQPPPAPRVPLPQVKVMRLALTKAGPINTAAAPRGSLLTLPTVFETIYAGQSLKCLARVLNAPRNCRVQGTLQLSKSMNVNEVGSAQGEGIVDLLIKGRLSTHGPHELILTCSTPTQPDLLRKVYKIDVSQSFVLDGAPRVTFVDDKILVRFVVKNVAKDMIARVSKVDFIPEKNVVLVPTNQYPDERSFDAVSIAPEEIHSFVFIFSLADGFPQAPATLGRLHVTWNFGLGEECELYFPQLKLDKLPVQKFQRQLSFENPLVTRWSVGKAVAVHISPSGNGDEKMVDDDFARETGLVVHGPRAGSGGGRAFIIPTRPGVISDVSKIYGLRERLPAFIVDGSSNDSFSSNRSIATSPRSIVPRSLPDSNEASSIDVASPGGQSQPILNARTPFDASLNSESSLSLVEPLISGAIKSSETVEDVIKLSQNDAQLDAQGETRERTLSEEMAQELLLGDGTDDNNEDNDIDMDVTAELEKELGVT